MSGRALVAVVLPGSGSDDDFVRRAFGGPLRALGIPLVAPAPRPGPGVLDGYRDALDAAAERAAARGEALLVGGVSLGAHVAAGWAARRGAAAAGAAVAGAAAAGAAAAGAAAAVPDRREAAAGGYAAAPVAGAAAAVPDRREAAAGGYAAAPVAGLLLALPAWTGAPGEAPAAGAARATAALVRSGGTAEAVRAARAGAPGWLADELARSWSGYGDGLACALDAAAGAPAPDAAVLAGLTAPAGVVACDGDLVHPVAVARAWCAPLPHARLVTTSLAALGADPATLGRAAVLGWLRARHERTAATRAVLGGAAR